MKNNYLKLAGAILAMFIFSVGIAAPTKHHVHAKISHDPSGVGELSIDIKAPGSDTFLLNIYDGGISVRQVTVPGGLTILAPLAIGKYSFNLLDSSGVEVEKGKFDVRPPHVHGHFKGTHLDDTLIFHVHAPAIENFELKIYSSTGALLHTLPVSGGENVMPALPLGYYTFTLSNKDNVIVETGKFKIKPRHVHAHVKGNHYNDSLTLHVHADTSEFFTVTIFNEGDTLLHTLNVKGGYNPLPQLAVGKYSFIMVDGDGYQVESKNFSVKGPNVHTGIYPNPSNPGEGSIQVVASSTESFTLNIYNSSMVLVETESIAGGTTLLPSTLTSGIYYYKVINSDGIEVDKGRIMVY